MKQVRAHSWFCYSLLPPVALALFGANYNNQFAWFLSGLASSPVLYLIGRRVFAWFFPVGVVGPASPSPSRHGRLGYRSQIRRARVR